MKCEICHLKDAVRAITQIVSGKPTELYVCEDCARTHIPMGRKNSEKKEEGDFPTTRSLTDVLFSLGMPLTPNQKITDATCPICGMTRGELRAKRRLGCPQCYSVFQTDIRSLVSEYPSSALREGLAQHEAHLLRTLEKFKAKMDAELAAEKYELANATADDIRIIMREATNHMVSTTLRGIFKSILESPNFPKGAAIPPKKSPKRRKRKGPAGEETADA